MINERGGNTMRNLAEEVRKLADLESGNLPNGEKVNPWDVPNFLLQEAWGKVEKKESPTRKVSGTFCAMVRMKSSPLFVIASQK